MRNEFKIKRFHLQYDNVDVFFKSQWQSSESNLAYLIFRLLVALGWTTLLIYSLIVQFYDGKFFIFLTNWALILLSVTQLVAAALVTRWHFSPQSRPYEMTLTLKCYWILFYTTVTTAFMITIMYWTFIYGNGKPIDNVTINYLSHLFNSVFMLVDLLIVAFPLHLLHTFYVLLLPTIFFIFSYIYFLCGGTDEYGKPYIYEILDWNEPNVVGMTVIKTIILSLSCAVTVFLIFKLRNWIHHLICNNKENLTY